MKTIKIEQCNGYEIGIRTVLVHDGNGRPEAEADATSAGGYAAFVQIARDGEVCVDWHMPQRQRRCATREDAEAQAMDYAIRLVERRPFDGPPPDFPEAA
ncbi:hypothetical protein GCT19_33570 [Paraburkholderia sp. CNPSo 3155]|uniref:hypothetical protein n=1 Tax=Paraburkholderia atlantica TaxID=2654982 RepID=UPI00036AE882|nr:hypothetical protein [Paraburkholderia atlantica]MPW10502.1 hypothetical protein [Paraburkholderia atlantica]NUY30900.1 hypothetical protein [Paraburkholderia atlantica]